MVTMETAIISLAENRVTLTIIGHCPLMVTAENSNTGHGAAYKLWSLIPFHNSRDNIVQDVQEEGVK